MTDMKHMNFIERVANEDVTELRRKEATYKGSWKRRGGVGAFMMLARKWDRLENMLASHDMQYDIFIAINDNPSGHDGTVLAEVRDLRRYLLLVEAEMAAQVPEPIKPSATAADLARAAGSETSSSSEFKEMALNSGETTTVEVRNGTSQPVKIRTIDPNFSEVLAGGKVYTRGDTPSCGDGSFDERSRRADEENIHKHTMIPARTVPRQTTMPSGGGLEPWICGADYFARKDVPVDMRAKFWNHRAAAVHVLEPHVVSGVIPRVLRDCYHMRGDHWTLRIDKCPPGARDMFPTLTREKNMKEHEELPEWQRVLYTWNEEGAKFELTSQTSAWAGEAE